MSITNSGGKVLISTRNPVDIPGENLSSIVIYDVDHSYVNPQTPQVRSWQLAGYVEKFKSINITFFLLVQNVVLSYNLINFQKKGYMFKKRQYNIILNNPCILFNHK